MVPHIANVNAIDDQDILIVRHLHQTYRRRHNADVRP
jgi:hypothetical protein